MKRPPSVRKSPPKRRGAKKATGISVQSEKQISAICTRFQLKGPILTYRDVQAALNRKYGLSLGVGTVWHLAHGRDPHKPAILRRLGLPVTVPVAVCPRHGVVHISRRCPADNPKPRHPSLRARRKRLIHDERWRGLYAGMRVDISPRQS